MDEAFCIDLNQIITSDELYYLENIKKLKFVCYECGVMLIPCSFKKGINIKKPYFKVNSDFPHKENCCVEGYAKIKSEGRNTRLTTQEGFPLPYPNRFKLRIEDVSLNPSVKNPGISSSTTRNHSFNIGEGVGIKKTYETTSFISVINQYFDFPYDRDREFYFEGIEGDTFDSIFKKIHSTYEKQEYRIQGKEKKVYFGELSWKNAKEENDIIRIELSAGKWNNRKKEKAYYLEIDFNSWPKQSKTKFIKKYEKTLSIIRNTKEKAIVAFVGTQDVTDDLFRFYSENRLLVTFKIFSEKII